MNMLARGLEPDYSAWEEVTETNGETKGDVLMETSPFPHFPIRTLKRGTDMGGFEKVDWLARGLLKRKNLNELLGDEGIGKSLFWIHLAAVITSGKGDETLGIEPTDEGRCVLYFAPEDDWSDTTGPRLVAAGADLSKIISPPANSFVKMTGEYIDTIVDELKDDDIDLVVLDPWSAALDGSVDNRQSLAVRGALENIQSLCSRLGAAGLLVNHTNSNTSGDIRTSGGTSAVLRRMVRSQLTAVADAEDDTILYVGNSKYNLAKRSKAVRYEKRGVQVDVAEGKEWIPRLIDHGHTDSFVEELFKEHRRAARDDSEKPPSPNELAKTFLRNYLEVSAEPVGIASIMAAAIEAGHAESTMKTWRNRLNSIGAIATGTGPNTGWSMAT